MLYGGHHYENITCKKCGFRHPASWTCEQAAHRAATARGSEQLLVNADHVELLSELSAVKTELEQANRLINAQHQKVIALKQALEEIIRISDRKHNAWDKAKELLK